MPSRLRSIAFCGYLALVLSVSTSARAQHDDEARGLFAAGAAAFQDGRYDEALNYFQLAYGESHRPQLLYNIGQAADRSRHDQVALDAFRAYLQAVPEIANRAEIEGRIRVLEHAVATHEAAPVATDPLPIVTTPEPAPDPVTATSEPTPPVVAPTPVPSPSPPPPPARGGIDLVGLALTVTGGVLAVAGVIMLAVGVPDLGPPRAGFLYASEVDRQNRGNALTGAGAASLGLGVIGAVIGTVMLATYGGDPPSSARLRVLPDGFLLTF